MKVKIDYVTNSSSTSFCMWGLSVPCYNVSETVIKKIYEKYSNDFKSKYPSYDEFRRNGNILHYLMNLCHDSDLEIIKSPFRNQTEVLYIGRDLSSMKDDETFGDFKKSVNEILEELGFDLFNIELLKGGW